METFYRPTWAEISLDALRHNIGEFRRFLPASTKLLASVKANAYGHGAIEIAREAQACGIDYLGVAFLDEALQLRRAGITAPILVLGFIPPDALELARANHITVTLFGQALLDAAAQLPEEGPPLQMHIKVDTGMGRLGLLPGEAALELIEQAKRLTQVHVEGIFTHYAKADEADKAYTQLQYTRFQQFVAEAEQRCGPFAIVHAGNSATGIDTPDWTRGMLRLGISMYGLYPSDEVRQEAVSLQPVMALKTRLAMVKTAPPQWGISYGTRYVTASEELIGTLPIGYADGYSRRLTGIAEVLIHGRRVPVRGTICMDQCMVGLADVPDAKVGDEVVLIGSQQDEHISVEEVAGQLGTIPYELICALAARVARVYTKQGKTVAIENALL